MSQDNKYLNNSPNVIIHFCKIHFKLMHNKKSHEDNECDFKRGIYSGADREKALLGEKNSLDKNRLFNAFVQ